MKEVYDVQITFYDTREYMPHYYVTKLFASGETKSELYIGITQVALEIMQTHDFLLLKDIKVFD